MKQELLKVTDLHISFKAKGEPVRAVTGVTFSVNKGETLGIVGEYHLALVATIPFPATGHAHQLTGRIVLVTVRIISPNYIIGKYAQLTLGIVLEGIRSGIVVSVLLGSFGLHHNHSRNIIM